MKLFVTLYLCILAVMFIFDVDGEIFECRRIK